MRFEILVLLLVTMQSGCIPESNPILAYTNQLKSSIDNKVLTEFVVIDENDRQIRKYFIELKPKALQLVNSNEDLKSYFNSIEVFEENSKSYLLLITLHKKERNKAIDIDSLVNEVKLWEEEVVNERTKRKKCDELQELNTNYNLTNFKEGDLVNLDIPIDERDNINNAVYFGCPLTYDTCNNEFLNIKVEILTKIDSNVFITKVISIEPKGIPILYRWYEIKDTFFLDLDHYHRKLY